MSKAFGISLKRIASSVTGLKNSAQVSEHDTPVLQDEHIALLASLPGLVSVHARNGDLVWANHGYKAEFPSHDTSRLGFLDQVNPQDRLNILDAIASVSKGEKTVSLKKQALDNASRVEVRNYEMQCSLYENGPVYHGEIMTLVLTRNTDAHDPYINELEQQIHDLRSTQEDKQNFFNTINHELRTPLNAIIGFSQMLDGQCGVVLKESKREEYVQAINISAKHSLDLVNDLLDLAKFEAGMQTLSEDQVDVSLLLFEVETLLSPIAAKCDVTLNVKQDRDLPIICSDKRSLKQIFINLIANALNHSNKGDAVDVIVTKRRKGLTITVEDTGQGMDSETLGKLGTAFFQAKTDGCEYTGTGLGLSIVHALVEMTGCSLSVQSELGRGSQFTVTIPVAAKAPLPVRSNPEVEVVYLKKSDSKKNEVMKTESAHKLRSK